MSGTGSSTDTSTVNGTTIVSGPNVIQVSDLYVKAGILHPVTVGATAIIVLFVCLRLGSNRSIAPLTTFDWLMNVALGSTLAGIVNSNSLVRGVLALWVLLAFQFITSTLCARFPVQCDKLLQARPLVIVFRGKLLKGVMKKHRISLGDVYCALRQRHVLNISQVECAIIEPNGAITIITMKDMDDSDVEPEVLTWIPAYRALCETAEKEGHTESGDIERYAHKELHKTGTHGSHALDAAASRSS